jgi:predicted nucleic acid-binding Zn ribbon protein
MNGNQTYWLCRAQGCATEGPFTLAQLTTMYGKGAVTAEAMLCEAGSRTWVMLVQVLEGGGKVAFIHSRKIRVGGSTLLAVCLFLIGLCMLISALFLIGLAIMAASGLVRAKYRIESFCSDCGNTVAMTSLTCPSCKAELELPPETSQQKMTKIFWWMLYAVIFFCIGLMIVNGLAPK